MIPGRAETDSVLEALGRQLALPSSGSVDPRMRVVHRLDKETTGVLLFALHVIAQRHLCHQFQEHTIEKEYLALVVGRVKTDTGDIDEPLGQHPTSPLKMAVVRHGGRPARTLYRVEERYRDFTLLRCFPKTGKTHQIRVHLAHIGHPLAIDPLYYAGRNANGLFLSKYKREYRPTRGQPERALISRLPLHAAVLKFNDLNGIRIDLQCDPPKDLRAITNMLARWNR